MRSVPNKEKCGSMVLAAWACFGSSILEMQQAYTSAKESLGHTRRAAYSIRSKVQWIVSSVKLRDSVPFGSIFHVRSHCACACLCFLCANDSNFIKNSY
jgi:hypothetical protein